jgi:hypothetical protein
VTDDELRSLFSGLQQEIGGIRQEMRQETGAIRQEIAAVREENITMHAQTRRHFDVALEAARHETQLVAERVGGLTERINDLDVKFTEIATDLDRRVVRLEIASSKR